MNNEELEELTQKDDLSGSRYDVDVFPDDHQVLEFGDMPAPVLPDKDVI